MLQHGNTASARDSAHWLGHAPRAVEHFVAPHNAAAIRTQARLAWLLPILRLSIALVWIVTGLVSLGIYPVDESYALLARAGVHGALAPVALYGAALLDVALGVATLAVKGRRLWWLQIAVIVSYSVIITIRLPRCCGSS